MNHDAIIEPSVNMYLEIIDGLNEEAYYEYTVCPSDDTDIPCQTGTKSEENTANYINFDCEPLQSYSITVIEKDLATDVVLSTSTGTALCMYVRREIRQLTTDDLATTMDTMYTLWSVKEADGISLYGENYHDYTYLLKIHHFNAAWQDSDHIHEGNGFMMQHLKLTNILEKSMQAVNPSVTLPYWDFTIDHANGKSAYDSYVMSEEVFGSMNRPSQLHEGYTYSSDEIVSGAIMNGRWKLLKAEKNIDYEELSGGYGYMRAPWNMNPSPYISRFTADYGIGIYLPTCESHYNILQYDNMMDFFVDMEDAPHATTHSLTGGIYGCDLLEPLLDQGLITDELAMKNICSKWVFYMKEFYRSNYLTPSTDCEVDESSLQTSSCSYICNEDTTQVLAEDLKTKLAAHIPSDLDEEDMGVWTDFICSGDGSKIFAGDHLESASPADPSFWVIHPTLERLLQAKLMAGGFSDESWASDSQDDYVCAKASCYENGVKEYHENCCYGHYESDQLLDAVTGSKDDKMGPTNGYMLESADPRSSTYKLEYIYDGFGYDHCDDDYDFAGLFDTMFAASLSRKK